MLHAWLLLPATAVCLGGGVMGQFLPPSCGQSPVARWCVHQAVARASAATRGRLMCRCLASGHHDEALAVAERGRTRAFADLLVERQTGPQESDPYSPVTVEQVLEAVHSQRGLVLYYSLAAGYLYSWLLAPGSGEAVGGQAAPLQQPPQLGLPPGSQPASQSPRHAAAEEASRGGRGPC